MADNILPAQKATLDTVIDQVEQLEHSMGTFIENVEKIINEITSQVIRMLDSFHEHFGLTRKEIGRVTVTAAEKGETLPSSKDLFLLTITATFAMLMLLTFLIIAVIHRFIDRRIRIEEEELILRVFEPDLSVCN
ncbi:unnamed protein product [Thelazia callipaeda]|uniref:t-SNARE coiled-coil homology domain-containing protein n=1 Tax=Thelazia callipaeda TaxID=103827 RepID=A0A0N5D5U8_THECL|nr:unnamed protein product [Thelazia callipaeda]